ncbi:MAG: glucose-6-phosphate isomerase [Myxococcota bacterium]
MDNQALWARFKKYLLVCDAVEVTLDISRMNFTDEFLQQKTPEVQRALEAMERLEAGAIANPDENRMVGHYWLRDAALAPEPVVSEAIQSCLADIRKFTRAVHGGKVKPQKAAKFSNVLVVGIGGSALGPQFVSRALGQPGKDKMTPYFLDNTDPDGMDAVFEALEGSLKETLTIVISKSGGTKETRNGMLEAQRAYEAAGLKFNRHVVAVTQEGSELDKVAVAGEWLARFPMWDWVGGRTSELSAVGLLPAALQGLDIGGMLAGARAMDEVTREKDVMQNPAALLALMWFHAGNGRGQKDMVLLPYKDRLELFSRYLQQLVMESLGKEKDLDGRVVNQGIAVYGNKGSTDQHAYVQQLREGVNNFFVTFIEVLRDRKGRSLQVEPGVTSGDYLEGFYLGTRRALYENGRESITVTVPDVSPETVGKLIALYERAVGLYASLININAYHQPGVEAGKKAAAAVLDLQGRVLRHLRANKGQAFSVEQIAQEVGAPAEAETVFKILQHVAANRDHGVKCHRDGSLLDATWSA